MTITTNLMVLPQKIESCKRWFVTFDGAECSPVPIDAVEYISRTNDLFMNRHQSRTITGHCKVTTNGSPIIIGFNIGNCKGYGDANGHTGWNAATRILVEEVNPSQK